MQPSCQGSICKYNLQDLPKLKELNSSLGFSVMIDKEDCCRFFLHTVKEEELARIV
jgi:hypothetical protein